jgi:hypothetical protein
VATSEVYMHIAIANFSLLSFTGPKMPADLNGDMEKTVTSRNYCVGELWELLDRI